jgi:hypothetical protein
LSTIVGEGDRKRTALADVEESLGTGALGCGLNPKARLTKEGNVFTFTIEESLK